MQVIQPDDFAIAAIIVNINLFFLFFVGVVVVFPLR